MPADVYWISGPWKGRLGIVPRPRGGEWLEDEIRSWSETEVGTVVSLLTGEEVAELDLTEEHRLCREASIAFLSFPVVDRDVPSSQETWMRLILNLRDTLRVGNSVAVHCRQSVGRAALVAASLLIVDGVLPKDALKRIGRARGCPVPDTEKQREWLTDLAASLSAAGR